MEIASNVHCIPGRIVNSFLIVDADGLTLIDTGFQKSGQPILKYIARLGYKPGDLRRILITHSDFDHVGGLAALKAATHARVYASPIEAEAIAAGHASRELKAQGLMRFVRRMTAILLRTESVTTDEYLTGGQTLPISGELHVIATPGHTPGHLSFLLPAAGILFCGDSLASARGKLNGFIGANTWDVEKAKASLRLQAALGAKIVCVAHGSVVIDAAGKFPKM